MTVTHARDQLEATVANPLTDHSQSDGTTEASEGHSLMDDTGTNPQEALGARGNRRSPRVYRDPVDAARSSLCCCAEDPEDSRSDASIQTGVVEGLLLDLSFVKRDVKHKPRVWATSAFAVALCVVAVSVLYTAVGNVGVIFLQMIEDKLGESDLLLLPTKNTPYINFTEVGAILAGEPMIAAAVPRWVIPATVSGATGAQEPARVVLYDSELEEAQHVSRQWAHRALKAGECHVSASVLSRLSASPGSQISVAPGERYVRMPLGHSAGCRPRRTIGGAQLELCFGVNGLSSRHRSWWGLCGLGPLGEQTGASCERVCDYCSTLAGAHSDDRARGSDRVQISLQMTGTN